MTGWLFLAAGLFAGSAKGFCGKKLSGKVSRFGDVLLANFIRLCMCAAVGAAIMLVRGTGFALSADAWLPVGLSALGTSMLLVSWLICVRRGAYMTLDAFVTLGLVVPVSLSRIFLGEPISVGTVTGIAVLVAAAFIMTSYNSDIKGKTTFGGVVLCVVCGLSQGVSDFSQKLFSKTGGDVAAFNFYTFVFSAVIILAVFLAAKGDRDEDKKTVPRTVPIIAAMAVLLFASAYFMTEAAAYLDAGVLYPVNRGLSIVISALMAAIFFGEKITVKSAVGMGLVFAGLILVTFL